jgi:tRNA dimethylallyltransferase
MVTRGQSPLVLLGSTGVGKTALALAYTDRQSSQILSADSRQVYRGMDIGTAKPTPAEQQRIPHHLIDLVDPDQPFTVSDFQVLGREVMKALNRAETPFIIVGGSPFYLYALLGDFFLPSVPANPDLRRELEKEADEKGLPALQARLLSLDPDSAQKIHPNDRRRIIRALEVYMLSGQTRSSFSFGRMESIPFRLVGLTMGREDLRQRLIARTIKMFQRGLVEEVQALLQRYPTTLRPLQSIGYKETIAYLEGQLDLETAQERIITASMQFAKRQMTWFRRDSRIQWVELAPQFDPEKEALQLKNLSFQ